MFVLFSKNSCDPWSMLQGQVVQIHKTREACSQTAVPSLLHGDALAFNRDKFQPMLTSQTQWSHGWPAKLYKGPNHYGDGAVCRGQGLSQQRHFEGNMRNLLEIPCKKKLDNYLSCLFGPFQSSSASPNILYQSPMFMVCKAHVVNAQ